MRLVTYNLHQGRDRCGTPVVDELADALAGLDPHVDAWQESLAGADSGSLDTVGSIAARFRRSRVAEHRFAPNTAVRCARLGNALIAPEELREHVAAADPRRPLVVCGDLNASRGGRHRAANRIGLIDEFYGVTRRARRTSPAWRPLFALDRVYVRGLRVRTARVLTGPPWGGLSDHLPAEATPELGAVTGDDA